ncbi:ferredoxin [Bdellovibrio bacteriovorus]|uniref:ferredoxin n=1 Tax=Bdellovibrio bacteriovorus TaxID=959 RepID=UPI0021D093D4|nr:ferredoxin [Bdellovibrio bacteriovorus]UXR63955.1 ferredoxin [Bdellovibrio bacteriovorus]
MEKENTANPVNFPQFFVGADCLSCGACWKEAPSNFRSHDIEASAYVYRQPQSEKELQECKAAQAICPVAIIGCINSLS